MLFSIVRNRASVDSAVRMEAPDVSLAPYLRHQLAHIEREFLIPVVYGGHTVAALDLVAMREALSPAGFRNYLDVARGCEELRKQVEEPAA